MDNLTHSLFGAAVAEVYVERKFKNSAYRPPKNVFYFFSIFANNCPDLDLLFGLIDNSSLGYLLNHRGWTHTVVGTFPQALLLWCMAWLWLRFVRRDLSPYLKDIGWIILLGMQTHMLLDYLNSYGVHPWAPFNSQWYYLDTIFIIEPLLWIALISAWLPPWKWGSALVLPPLAAYAFGWWNQIVPLGVLLTASVFAMIVFQIQSLLLKVHRGVVAVLLFAAVICIFWGGQHWARTRVLHELAKDGAKNTLDVVMYSLPSNPICWFFLAPQVSGESYTVLHGSVSLFGNSQNCRAWPTTDASMNALPPSPLGELSLRQEWTASLRDFQPLLTRCDVRAWLQFVRVPYWENFELSDLRFSARSKKSFTSLDLQDQPEPVCPVLEVPWTPPRQDLIDLMNNLSRQDVN